jgi:fucose 4-O-acetylase-like acetyltransferase
MARRLLFLNGLATVGLVLNHASSWAFIAMFWWTDRYRNVPVPNFDAIGGISYYVLRIVEQLVAFTVPAFLFVSGFFVAFMAGQEPLRSRWTGVQNRLRSLLAPYVLWSTVLLVERYVQGRRYSPAGYLTIYLTGRAAEPYYFIPLLCQCLLLAPLLIEWAKKHATSLLWVSAGVQLMVQGLRYPMALEVSSPMLRLLLAATPSWIFLGKIFWFSFGLVAGLHPEPFQRRVAQYKWHWMTAAALLLGVGALEWELIMNWSPSAWTPYFDTALDGLYAAPLILAVIAFGPPRSPVAESVEEVGRHSYGVYLVHAVVLTYAARGAYHLVPGLLEHSLFFLGFLVVIGLGAPLLAMRMVRRSPFRGAYRYVFG